MAVPASGELKLWDTLWNQEIGGTKGENSLHSASVYAGFSTPDALSDFYGWSDVEAPTVTTNAISSLAFTSMTLNGNVTSTGNEAVTRGFYFGNIANPYSSNTKLSLGGTQNSTGPFSCAKTGLTAQTLYYAWAFACNSAGEAVGSRVQATTPAPPFTPTLYDFGLTSRNLIPAPGPNASVGYINPYTSGVVTLGNCSAVGSWTANTGGMVCSAQNACNRSYFSNTSSGGNANAICAGHEGGRFNNRSHSVQTNQLNPGNPQYGTLNSSTMKCSYFFGLNPYVPNSFGTLTFCFCTTPV